MKLPMDSKNLYDIVTPYIPYLKKLPHVLWRKGNLCAVRVSFNSQKSLKEAVSILGYYFKRENQYDFPPYESEIHTDDSRNVVLLLNELCRFSYHAMGCIEFDCEQCRSSVPDRWMLHWAWMHPYCRGKGYMSAMYPRLLETFGDFYFQCPLSKAMRHVVFKCGTDAQKKLLE